MSQAEAQAIAEEIKKLELEIETVNQTITRLSTQQNENDMVVGELKLIDEESNVYKLIGPVLIKQEKDEAISNVEKRLEFIKAESKKAEARESDLEKQLVAKKTKLEQMVGQRNTTAPQTK